MKKRDGENIEKWLRCSRFYSLNESWYFSTREGVDHGPYESREEATRELENFIQEMIKEAG